jgi:acetyltransferase-like isoleucine patch superfamily enzyme
MVRASLALERAYTRHFLRPQVEELGEGAVVRKPWYVRLDGPEIRIGRFTQIVGAWGRPVELCTFSNGEQSGEIQIGDHCLISPGVRISAATRVEVGDDSMLAAGVYLTDADWHDVHDRTRSPGRSEPIVLERNVWIGDGVTVCKGVRVGENSVVGAGSVVVNDIPSNSIAAGNPARVVRELHAGERLVTRATLFREPLGQMEARNAFLRFYTLCGNTFAGWLRARLFPRATD